MDTDTQTGSISVVPLGTTFFHGSYISHELLTVLQEMDQGEKALIFYNRRGSGRAWICEDCSYFPVCPECSIALSYHSYPYPQLVCHHCSYRREILTECPSCAGMRFHEVGIGIQKVTQDLKKLLPKRSVFRFDSDTKEKKSHLITESLASDITISTYAGLPLLHDVSIRHIFFLLFESDLTLPDYRMEEDLYHALEYAKKSGKMLHIQTYMPDHPLLKTFVEGNYKDFLHYMSRERKNFSYPPYGEFVTIRVHDRSKEKLENMLSKLVNKIQILTENDPLLKDGLFFAYDQEILDRSRGEWVAKILLKGKNVSLLLEELEVEILRNRSITLEWN